MASDVAGRGPLAEHSLIVRHPLISYFVIAFAISWLIEATFVLSRDGSGLLAFSAPLSFMATVGLATSVGPGTSNAARFFLSH
jgi:hypothetical protein